MKPKQAIQRILCKFGFHNPRVIGHANAKEGTEYYYDCGWCDDNEFWDYAMTSRSFNDIDNAMKLKKFIDKHPGITTSEILDRISNADHWKILEALDQLESWELIE
ncbi:MAG: hypothetical protein KJI71_01365 [Patescibacteria group bacterium]|nr:hypothetical protein [Patescibacteria group bacterium]